MEINYENRIEDREEYCNFLLNSKKQGQSLRILIILILQVIAILTAVVIGLFVWLLSLGSWRDGLLFAFLGFFAGEFGLLLRANFRPVHYYGNLFCKKTEEIRNEKEKNNFFLPKRLSINEEWFQVETCAELHRWQWSAIKEVALSANLIIIRIDRSYRYLIPKRDFDSEDDFHNFWKHILKYKEMDSYQTVESV
jgi:hypothetical protein